MKRKPKAGSGIWQYLADTNVLDGPPELIEAARKEYWRRYKNEWRRSKRVSFTVSLTNAEAKELAAAARAHRNSPTRFIKQALLAYMRSAYIVPNVEATQTIQILLSKNYCVLQDILDDRSGSVHTAEQLLLYFTALEQQILEQLLRPHTIEWHIAKAIEEHPEYKSRLYALFHTDEP